MTEENIKVVLTTPITKIQADLVQRGLQSRVRAIMAIYGIEREEAEKVLSEIDLEIRKFGRVPIVPFPVENKNQ